LFGFQGVLLKKEKRLLLQKKVVDSPNCFLYFARLFDIWSLKTE